MKDLLTYNAKCNDIFAHYILEANLAHRKIIEVFSHIQNTQQIWNERILGEETTVKPWDMVVMRDAFEINKLNYKTSVSILENIDLAKRINYTTSKGESYENTVEEIMFHILNNSIHQRAIIGTMMPKFGVNPPSTDYIIYKRESADF